MKNKTKIVAALLGGSALLANNKNIKQKDNSRLEEFEYIEKDNFKDLEVKTKTLCLIVHIMGQYFQL
jgi:hypothetical protein